MIDLNNHLLGEYGSEISLDKALESCRQAWRNGVKEVVVTRRFAGPQVVVPELIAAMRGFECRLHQLRQLLEEESGSDAEGQSARTREQLRIAGGYEWGLSADLPERLRQLPLAPSINGGHYLLTGFPAMQPVSGAAEICAALQSDGWRPIIAHPECSRALRREAGLLDRLTDTGALIQIDAASLLGRYGSEVERFALNLLEQNKVSFIATRTDQRARQQISLAEASQRIRRLVGRQLARTLVYDNPLAILLQPEPVDLPQVAGPWRMLESAVTR